MHCLILLYVQIFVGWWQGLCCCCWCYRSHRKNCKVLCKLQDWVSHGKLCVTVVFGWDMSVEVMCCGLQFPWIAQGKWYDAIYVHPEYPRWSDMLQYALVQDMSVEVTCCGLQFLGISKGKWYAAVYVHPEYPRWSDIFAVRTCLGYVCWSDILLSAVYWDMLGEVICCSLCTSRVSQVKWYIAVYTCLGYVC